MHSKKQQINSLDELLEIAQSDVEISIADINNDNYSKVERFVNTFNLKSGSNKITGKILYNIFKKTNKGTDLNSVQFYLILDNYIESAASKNNKMYLINKTLSNLHHDELKIKNKPVRTRLYNDKNLLAHFESFVKEKNFIVGDVKINCRVIYYLYLNWVYSNNKKSYGYDLMRIYLNKLLKVTRIGEIRFLHLNIEKFKEGTTENEYKAAIKWSEKNFKKKKNKENI